MIATDKSRTQVLVNEFGAIFWGSLAEKLHYVYRIYRDVAYKACPGKVAESYAVRVRWALAEGALYAAAVENKMDALDADNSAHSSGHVEIFANLTVATMQFSRKKFELGIWAEYRQSLAGLPFQDDFFSSEAPAFKAENYLLITHGFSTHSRDELGFLQAGIPNKALNGYIEAPVNILESFGAIDQPAHAQPVEVAVPKVVGLKDVINK